MLMISTRSIASTGRLGGGSFNRRELSRTAETAVGATLCVTATGWPCARVPDNDDEHAAELNESHIDFDDLCFNPDIVQQTRKHDIRIEVIARYRLRSAAVALIIRIDVIQRRKDVFHR